MVISVAPLALSEVFPFADIPDAHEKMLDNKHLPGNMAVLVTSHSIGGAVGDLAGKSLSFPTSGAVVRDITP